MFGRVLLAMLVFFSLTEERLVKGGNLSALSDWILHEQNLAGRIERKLVSNLKQMTTGHEMRLATCWNLPSSSHTNTTSQQTDGQLQVETFD